MPLVIGKEILAAAKEGGYTVPSFNTNNLETTQAILDTAEKMRAPVFVQLSNSALGYGGPETLPNLVRDMASRVSVPVALHLDHGSSYEKVLQALRAGFTSVMIDASHHPLEENIAESKKCIEAAHAVGVSTEAELGRLGGIEDDINVSAKDAFLTDPDEAEQFVSETGVDYLAVAIGTSHGAYKGKGRPYIDHDRIELLSKRLGIPLVMHGSSGVPKYLTEKLRETGSDIGDPAGIHDDDIRRVLPTAVAKVNVDTDLRLALTAGVREILINNPKEFDPRKILGKAREYMAQIVAEKFELMGTAGKA